MVVAPCPATLARMRRTWTSVVAATVVVLLGGFLVQQSIGTPARGPQIDAAARVSPGATVDGDPQTSRVGGDDASQPGSAGPDGGGERADPTDRHRETRGDRAQDARADRLSRQGEDGAEDGAEDDADDSDGGVTAVGPLPDPVPGDNGPDSGDDAGDGASDGANDGAGPDDPGENDDDAAGDDGDDDDGDDSDD
jgi:hypothetical protein